MACYFSGNKELQQHFGRQLVCRGMSCEEADKHAAGSDRLACLRLDLRRAFASQSHTTIRPPMCLQCLDGGEINLSINCLREYLKIEEY